jgi:hypothetical protein
MKEFSFYLNVLMLIKPPATATLRLPSFCPFCTRYIEEAAWRHCCNGFGNHHAFAAKMMILIAFKLIDQ